MKVRVRVHLRHRIPRRHCKRLRSLLIRARRRQRLHALLDCGHVLLPAVTARRQVGVRREPVRRQLPSARVLSLLRRWQRSLRRCLRPPRCRLPRSPRPPADGRNHEAARQPTHHHDLRGLVRASPLLRLRLLLGLGIIGRPQLRHVQSFICKAHRAVDHLRSSAGLRREETGSQGGEAQHCERSNPHPNRRRALLAVVGCVRRDACVAAERYQAFTAAATCKLSTTTCTGPLNRYT